MLGLRDHHRSQFLFHRCKWLHWQRWALTNNTFNIYSINAGSLVSSNQAALVAQATVANASLTAANLTGTISTNQLPPAVVLTNGAVSGQIPVYTNNAWTWMTPAAGGGGGSGNASTNNAATQYWTGVQALTNTANAWPAMAGHHQPEHEHHIPSVVGKRHIPITGGNEYWPVQNPSTATAGFGRRSIGRRFRPASLIRCGSTMLPTQ